MARTAITDSQFINKVVLVDTDLWAYSIFPIGTERERAEFWDRQNEKFVREMSELGDGHFTWQTPVQFVSPNTGKTYTSHSSPEPHYHYYVGKDDGYEFRIPLT